MVTPDNSASTHTTQSSSAVPPSRLLQILQSHVNSLSPTLERLQAELNNVSREQEYVRKEVEKIRREMEEEQDEDGRAGG